MRPLIIGYGNTQRSDDGLGQVAARELSRRLDGCAQVIAVDQLNPELAESIAGTALVVFIDVLIGDDAGVFSTNRLQPDLWGGSVSTHYCTPEELLGLAHKLYGCAPEAHLFSITGAEFTLGQELSEPVLAAMPQLLAGVESLIRRQAGEPHAE